MFKPCTKWADRVHHVKRIPELINLAIEHAMSGKPGPVYLDLPGDILYGEIDEIEGRVSRSLRPRQAAASGASANDLSAIVELLAKAKQPVLITGAGVQWSEAEKEMLAFVEAAGIPFYTTPQGRGVIPEDHKYCYLTSRAAAFRDADLILVVGTRMNYIIGHAAPPRWNANAKIVRIDIDPIEIASVAAQARRRRRRRMPGSPSSSSRRRSTARSTPATYETWRERLRTRNVQKTAEAEQALSNGASPIHPLRLCKEVRDFMDRDCVLCVDGQEILNFGRQAIPQFTARHRINSGAFGTMGVGHAVRRRRQGGAARQAGDRAARRRLVRHERDGVRHRRAPQLPILTIISQNGGWTGDPNKEKPGRDLGYPRSTSSPRRSAATASMSRSPTTSARRSSAPRRRWRPASRRWSASSPTTMRARRRPPSPTTRPEYWSAEMQTAGARAPAVLIQ